MLKNECLSSAVFVVINKWTRVVLQSVFYAKIFLQCEITSEAKLKLFFPVLCHFLIQAFGSNLQIPSFTLYSIQLLILCIFLDLEHKILDTGKIKVLCQLSMCAWHLFK